MAKRRKMGLHGSPEHHRQKAEKLANVASKDAKVAIKLMGEGRCAEALDALVFSSKALGEMTAHAQEGHIAVSSLLRESFHPANSDLHHLIRSCAVKKKGGLGAMRRRRSRR
jgi:hypothetical protein